MFSTFLFLFLNCKNNSDLNSLSSWWLHYAALKKDVSFPLLFGKKMHTAIPTSPNWRFSGVLILSKPLLLWTHSNNHANTHKKKTEFLNLAANDLLQHQKYLTEVEGTVQRAQIVSGSFLENPQHFNCSSSSLTPTHREQRNCSGVIGCLRLLHCYLMKKEDVGKAVAKGVNTDLNNNKKHYQCPCKIRTRVKINRKITDVTNVSNSASKD